MLRGILIASRCATLLGCSATIEPGTTPRTTNPDPVASFKRIVEDGFERAHARYNYLSEPSYDVRRTESLVSPYTATLTLRGFAGEYGEASYQFDYAFQDNQWILNYGNITLILIELDL